MFGLVRSAETRATIIQFTFAVFLCVMAHYDFHFAPLSILLMGLCLLVASRAFTVSALVLAAAYAICLAAWPAIPYSPYPPGLVAVALFLALKKRLVEHRESRFTQTLRPWLLLVFLAGLSRVASRDTRILPILCWSVLASCVYLASRLPSETPVGQRIRNGAANALLLVTSVAMMLGFGEMVCRLAAVVPPPSTSMFRWDPEYVFRSNPSCDAIASIQSSKTGKLQVRQVFSSQGVRDHEYGPKEPGEYRILMLGDSFTQGLGVAPEDSIPKQLEQLLASRGLPKRVSVINAGLSASGPLQELGMLRQVGLKFGPDLAILQLFPSNDIENSLIIVNKRFRAYDVNAQDFLRFVRGYSYLPCRLELWMAEKCLLYHTISYSLQRRGLITDMFLNCRFYPAFKVEELPPREDRPAHYEADLREWYPELEEAFAIFQKDILEIARVCQEHSILFIAYIIPKQDDICDYMWGWAPHLELYERAKSFRITDEFLNRQGIASCPVADALRTRCGTDAIYYRFDGHTTATGNHVIAEQIAEYLSEQFFPHHSMAPEQTVAPPRRTAPR